MTASDGLTDAAAPVDTQGAVTSPCVSVCRMEAATGLCAGCWRTLDEIAAWSRMSEPAKRAVWAKLPARGRVEGSGQ
jgi:predicted Fe-S protein YdhL (DUF1289 family)